MDQTYIPSSRKRKRKYLQKPPFVKRLLLVDDDPDVTLTFKAGLDRAIRFSAFDASKVY